MLHISENAQKLLFTHTSCIILSIFSEYITQLRFYKIELRLMQKQRDGQVVAGVVLRVAASNSKSVVTLLRKEGQNKS